MEMHQLRYVAAVASTGNFSRAAEQCHVAQPSLSQQIQKLEEELGERLFDRLPRSVKLTAAGESFLPRALRILTEADTALQEAREAGGVVRGRLALGALPTIAPYFLGPILAEFGKKFPGVQVTVFEETTAQLLKLLEGYEIDLAITSLPIDETRFTVHRLFSEELLLALPTGHPLATKRSVSVADVENQKFILLKEGHCLGDQVLRFCHRNDFQPQIGCRSTQIETIKALVRANLGVSLVPQMAIHSSPSDGVCYRSFVSPEPERSIVAIQLAHRPLTGAGREMLATVSGATRKSTP